MCDCGRFRRARGPLALSLLAIDLLLTAGSAAHFFAEIKKKGVIPSENRIRPKTE